MLRFRWRSLQTSIIAWSFVPTTIILVAVALMTFYAYQRVTEDLVIGRNREVTRFSAGQLSGDLREYSDLLYALGRTSDVYGGDMATQRAALKKAKDRLVVFDAGVVLLDNFGRVVAAEPERPEILGHDWSDRPYFRQMLRSLQVVFSDVVPDGPQGADVIVVAVPVTDNDGELRGLLGGMFRLGDTAVSALYGSIAKLRIGESGGAYLVDSAGRVLYHTDPDRINTSAAAQPIVQQALTRAIGDARIRDPSGREIAASYAPVPETPWSLITEEQWGVLMSSSQGYRQSLLLLLCLGVIVPALVVTFGVRRITGSIDALIAAAQEVAGGNFGRTITAPAGGELEVLANQFNAMSSRLQESYATLERRVADRTRDLATLNAIASAVSRSLELEEVLHDALDKTMEVVGMQTGGAYRLDEASETLFLMAHRGLSDRLVRLAGRLSLEDGAAGQVDGSAHPIVRSVVALPDSTLRRQLEAEEYQQIVTIPLVAKGRLLGVINLGTRSARSLTTEELSLLAGVGQQIGVAVENARLYERAEESAAAAERSRLARDLHDAVSQTLFSASLIAEVLPRLYERNPEEGHRRLEELRQLTRGALAEMRTLLLELRPAVLREAALGDLLRQLTEAFVGRSRLPVKLVTEGECKVPADVQVGFYRIAQEALNNVAKHSAASNVMVALYSSPTQVEMVISDDGRGFDPAQIPADHLGVGIMRERAQAAGATLRITSEPGQGTCVAVVWKSQT